MSRHQSPVCRGCHSVLTDRRCSACGKPVCLKCQAKGAEHVVADRSRRDEAREYCRGTVAKLIGGGER